MFVELSYLQSWTSQRQITHNRHEQPARLQHQAAREAQSNMIHVMEVIMVCMYRFIASPPQFRATSLTISTSRCQCCRKSHIVGYHFRPSLPSSFRLPARTLDLFVTDFAHAASKLRLCARRALHRSLGQRTPGPTRSIQGYSDHLLATDH